MAEEPSTRVKSLSNYGVLAAWFTARACLQWVVRGELIGLIRVRPLKVGEDTLTGIAELTNIVAAAGANEVAGVLVLWWAVSAAMYPEFIFRGPTDGPAGAGSSRAGVVPGTGAAGVSTPPGGRIRRVPMCVSGTFALAASISFGVLQHSFVPYAGVSGATSRRPVSASNVMAWT
ncbi:hypothetical protein [Streptomyces katsurahamanus]|uniref:hypothetical protein n=1 Tax=Streptomyces katsurahamanus TaxID=2577098 RepID=UPI0018867689|nr:hypothetical protein [Streptomyces katsurahamanus]